MFIGKSAVLCQPILSPLVPQELFPFPSSFGCACLEFVVGGLKLDHSALLWVVHESLILFSDPLAFAFTHPSHLPLLGLLTSIIIPGE